MTFSILTYVVIRTICISAALRVNTVSIDTFRTAGTSTMVVQFAVRGTGYSTIIQYSASLPSFTDGTFW
jgi:hypothetical protein